MCEEGERRYVAPWRMQQIIRLFFERSEQAITGAVTEVRRTVLQIADNILDDPQDAEECVNDAWLGA